jgi:hypothetical protein
MSANGCAHDQARRVSAGARRRPDHKEEGGPSVRSRLQKLELHRDFVARLYVLGAANGLLDG